MNWLEDHLQDNEQVIYKTRMHKYYFIAPLIILLLSFFNAWFLLVIVPFLIYSAGSYFYYEYVITDSRVIIKKGFSYIRTEDILIDEIEDVLIRRSLADKVIGAGTIFIFGSTISTRKLNKLEDPATFRSALYSQLPSSNISYYEQV